MLTARRGALAHRRVTAADVMAVAGVAHSPIDANPQAFNITIDAGADVLFVVSHTEQNVTGDLVPAVAAGSTAAAVATDDVVTSNGHGLANDTPVVVISIGASVGYTAGVVYYVIDSATNTFKLSATLGGAAVNVTTAGSITWGRSMTSILTHTHSVASLNKLTLWRIWDPPTGTVTINRSKTGTPSTASGELHAIALSGPIIHQAPVATDTDEGASVTELANVVNTGAVANCFVIGAVGVGNQTLDPTVDDSPAGEQTEVSIGDQADTSSRSTVGFILDAGSAGNQTVAWKFSASAVQAIAIAAAFEVTL